MSPSPPPRITREYASPPPTRELEVERLRSDLERERAAHRETRDEAEQAKRRLVEAVETSTRILALQDISFTILRRDIQEARDAHRKALAEVSLRQREIEFLLTTKVELEAALTKCRGEVLRLTLDLDEARTETFDGLDDTVLATAAELAL